LTSAKASGKAPTSSDYPISSSFRTKYSVSISGEFVNKSIEIEPSAFISKLLDKVLITILLPESYTNRPRSPISCS
jgi:hypothetical protein